MKKQTFFLIIATIVLLFAATGQNTHPNGNDSTIVSIGVDTGIKVGEVITGHAPLIPFIPDSVLKTAICSLILGIWARWAEKRRLRKQGKLIDKQNENANNGGNEPK